jgi:hypothetical protein
MSGEPCSVTDAGARRVRLRSTTSAASLRPSRRSHLRPGLSQCRQAGSQPPATRRPWQDRHAGGVVASANGGRRRRPNRDWCSSPRDPRDRPSRSVHTEILGVRGTQPDRTGEVVSHYRCGSPTFAVIDTTPLRQLNGQGVVAGPGIVAQSKAPSTHVPSDGPTTDLFFVLLVASLLFE